MTDHYSGPPHAPSILTIDLDALAQNYRILCDAAGPSVPAAVVKADGYGLGTVPVSQTLWDAGCRVFFTAHFDEAVAVKECLPQEATVGVLNGLMTGEETRYRDYNILPTLNDLGQIQRWAAFCRSYAPLPASLHIDTGMSRLGMPPAEVDTLLAAPSDLEAFPVKFLMSHLACADMPDHPLNRKQQQAFALRVGQLPHENAMLAASSGVFLGPDWHFDMVRTGVALYGGAPNEDTANPMKPVVRVQAKILQVRSIDAPETVGYGASYTASQPRKVATIAAGYADGYLRSLSSRASVHYGDKKLPVLGRVSMDLIGVDVTEAPEAQVGDMIDLIGPNNDINAVAKAAGTIPYEILTSLGRRYRRHYVGGRVEC